MREVVTVVHTESHIGIYFANTELKKTIKWLEERNISYSTEFFATLKEAKQYIIENYAEKSETDLSEIKYNWMQKYHTIVYYCYFDNDYRALFKEKPFRYLPNGKSIISYLLEEYEDRGEAIESFRNGAGKEYFAGVVYDDMILAESQIPSLNSQQYEWRELQKRKYVKINFMHEHITPLE